MAVFRFITAEEEATTAIFRSLQRLGYPDADRLNPKNHIFKTALRPFLQAVGNILARFAGSGYQFGYRIHAAPDDTVEVFFQPPGETRLGLPTPPLGFSIEEGLQEQLTAALQPLLGAETVEHVTYAIRARADFRNRLLYACDDGVPALGWIDLPRVHELRDGVYRMLVIYLLVDQTEAHQDFVLQLLPLFLALAREVRRIEVDAGMRRHGYR